MPTVNGIMLLYFFGLYLFLCARRNVVTEIRYFMVWCAVFVDGERKTAWHATKDEAMHDYHHPPTTYIVVGE